MKALRLLIVDDHDFVRDALRLVLSEANLQRIEEATTFDEAVQLVRDAEFDLVLLDVAQFHGRGLEILDQIRAIRPELPLLVHSFDDPARILDRCYRSGACGYFLKGGDIRALMSAISRAAAGHDLWTIQQLDQIEGFREHNASERVFS